MQIKVNAISTQKHLNKLAKDAIEKATEYLLPKAHAELSAMDMPHVTGTLSRSYVARRVRKDTIRLGSQAADEGYKPVVYANKIETVKTTAGNTYRAKVGASSKYTEVTTSGKGYKEFEKAKKRVLKHVQKVGKVITK